MPFAKRIPIKREWDIEGYPNYFISGKKLYRETPWGEIKENREIIIGYTHGFYLKSKFISFVRLRQMLRKHEEISY
jgi:hypothetical protein